MAWRVSRRTRILLARAAFAAASSRPAGSALPRISPRALSGSGFGRRLRQDGLDQQNIRGVGLRLEKDLLHTPDPGAITPAKGDVAGLERALQYKCVGPMRRGARPIDVGLSTVADQPRDPNVRRDR